MNFRLHIVVLCLLCACITPVHGLHKDQSFHYANVIEGGLLIGGVTSIKNHLLPDLRAGYADLLLRTLQQERASYRLQGAGLLETRMGTDAYHTLLDAYRQHGNLSEQALANITSQVHQWRYIIFARIVSNQVNQNSDVQEESVYVDDASQQNAQVVDYINRTKTWTTSRGLNTQLHVYDLKNKKLVWRGSINKTDSNTNEYTEQTYHRDGVGRELLNSAAIALLNNDEQGYPTDISTSSVLQSVMQGFAENMPRQDGRR